VIAAPGRPRHSPPKPPAFRRRGRVRPGRDRSDRRARRPPRGRPTADAAPRTVGHGSDT
jgi:hypothetical protein